MSLLRDVAAGPLPAGEGRPAPLRLRIGYDVAERARTGDLYLADEQGTGPRLVLVPGAAEGGKDDPRLVAFAQSLARAGFTVLVPDIAAMRALRISAADASDIADAVLWHSRREQGAAPVGLIAISYALGPTILAALDEEAGPRVRFILGVGGYYDIEAAVTFFTTGMYREGPDRPWRHRPPNAYGKWVFVLGNAGRLTDAGDAALLRTMAERKMRSPAAHVADIVARLGPEGRAVHALLDNANPERVPSFIAGLPEGIRSEMAALDLRRRNLSRLGAKLYLLHGRDDAIIPYTESESLAGAAGDAALYLVDGLAHVDLGPTGLGDSLTLVELAYDLLRERDGMKQ